MSHHYGDLRLFIGGEWIAAGTRDTLPVINPASEETLAALPVATSADLDRAIECASAGFKVWRRISAYDRAAVLRRAAGFLRERLHSDAVLMTLEQGKPLSEARTELSAAADFFDWYAEEGRRAYGRIIPGRVPGPEVVALTEPVGPVAAFSPWNFPASQPARKLAAALGAGCSVVLKPAEETPASALALARALESAGLPAGVLNVVFGMPADISARLIAAPEIRKVSFTGSTVVGRLIGALAAQSLKPTTLELGGHAPVLVFEDADIEKAVTLSVGSKYRNAGQTCISPTRFYIQRRVYERFVSAFAQKAAEITLGSGLEPTTRMGPLANSRRMQAMQSLTAAAVAAGGRVLTGGCRRFHAGYFWSPTTIADLAPEARPMREEPFGPIALMRPFDTVEEGVDAANSLPYGLAAYAFTRDRATAAFVRLEIESGLLGLNTFSITWPETPFGGVKDSGHGREGGSEGLEAYLTTKLVTED
jgi:succinate-semialdehyde dehydrogenase / glutarate-semialdehyde dehydrogenase